MVQFGIILQRFKQEVGRGQGRAADMGNKRLAGMQGELHGIKQSSKPEVKYLHSECVLQMNTVEKQ